MLISKIMAVPLIPSGAAQNRGQPLRQTAMG